MKALIYRILRLSVARRTNGQLDLASHQIMAHLSLQLASLPAFDARSKISVANSSAAASRSWSRARVGRGREHVARLEVGAKPRSAAAAEPGTEFFGLRQAGGLSEVALHWTTAACSGGAVGEMNGAQRGKSAAVIERW